MSNLSISAQIELRELSQEAENLSKQLNLTKQETVRFNTVMSRISLLKSGALSDEVRMKQADALAKELGLSTERLSEEQRSARKQNSEFREYLRKKPLNAVSQYDGYAAEEKRGMTVGTDTAGGFFVPQTFYEKVTFALKLADGLWDDSVITLFEDTHGNVLTLPVIDDTSVNAAIIAESVNSAEAELAVIDRVQLGKIPTWRSKKLVTSLELLQDSAFPLEDAVIAPAVAGRFQRGIGAANAATLLTSATSGATSVSPTSVSIADTLALLGSIEPGYLNQPKTFFAMNFQTLIGLLSEKDTAGRYQWKPRTDANGRMLLHNVPVVIMPSLPSAAANAAGTVVLGDFSRCVRRIVKDSFRILRYEQSVSLAENGLVAYEGFIRTSFGVLATGSTNSPLVYLTQHA